MNYELMIEQLEARIAPSRYGTEYVIGHGPAFTIK